MTSGDIPISREQVAAWLKQLRLAVIIGATETREHMRRQWAQPLAERVSSGVALAELRITENRQDGAVRLACPVNRARFREGDFLVLHRGDPAESPRFRVTLEEDDDTTLLVLLEDPGIDYGALLRNPTGWVLDEGFLDLSAIILAALDEVADSATGRERVLPLLTGERTPLLDMVRYDDAEAYARTLGFNPAQIEAFAASYATDLAYLVQGPPGTGKTRVLAHLADRLVQDGERVLITAHTHRAINHALNTLVERVNPDIAAIKVGQPARAHDLLVTNYEYFSMSPLVGAIDGYVVGATSFATRTRRLTDVVFDTVIMDEASQVTVPLAMMAMLKAERYIVVGDHKQLPPVGGSSLPADAIERTSVFRMLVGRGFDTMLTDTYRMNAAITDWPSRQFYDGALQPATPEIAQRRMVYPFPPAQLADILDPQIPAVWVDVPQFHARSSNAAEAQLVADLVQTVLDCGLTPEQLGVVAPYRAQARAIRRCLKQAGMEYAERQQVVIDTVERMQGQERDLIILTLTTGDRAFAAQLAAFLFQPERLNVAITRPRSKLIILGSPELLTTLPDDPALLPHVELLADLRASLPRRVYPLEEPS